MPESEVEVVDDGSAVWSDGGDDDHGEEITQEEYERELKRMRMRRRVGSVMGAVAGAIVALLIVALLIDTGILPGPDDFEPTDLTLADLTVPNVPAFPVDFGDTAPTPSTGLITPQVNFGISYVTSDVYAGRGGVMRVNVTNRGSTDFYLRQLRMVPQWAGPGETFATGYGKLVPVGEEVTVGLLGFSGPDAAGTYEYHFELDTYVQRPSGTWATRDGLESQAATMEVLDVQSVLGYPMYSNDKNIYRDVNDLVEPNDPAVAQLASELRQGLGDAYNLYWLAALFDWVRTELEYTSDPSDEDTWSPAGYTCSAKAGDCEDFSILIASVVESWGGNARFYVISNHAFAGVYVGGPGMDTSAVAEAFNEYYGTSARYSWFVDELGYWMIADGTSSQYLGGLPFNGVATDLTGGWDIKDTEYLYITDVYPNYPE